MGIFPPCAPTRDRWWLGLRFPSSRRSFDSVVAHLHAFSGNQQTCRTDFCNPPIEFSKKRSRTRSGNRPDSEDFPSARKFSGYQADGPTCMTTTDLRAHSRVLPALETSALLERYDVLKTRTGCDAPELASRPLPLRQSEHPRVSVAAAFTAWEWKLPLGPALAEAPSTPQATLTRTRRVPPTTSDSNPDPFPVPTHCRPALPVTITRRIQP